MKIGGNHADLGRQRQPALPVQFHLVGAHGSVIVQPQHRDAGPHHVHRARVLWRRQDVVHHAGRQLPLRRQPLLHLLQLLPVRQLSRPKQMAHLLERDLSGQFVDVVAPVDQLPLQPAHIGNGGGCGHHPLEPLGNHLGGNGVAHVISRPLSPPGRQSRPGSGPLGHRLFVGPRSWPGPFRAPRKQSPRRAPFFFPAGPWPRR